MWRPILLSLCLIAAGCETVRHSIDRVSGAEAAKDKEIASLQADFDQKMNAKVAELKKAQEDQVTTKETAITAAANAFYAQDMVYRSIPSPLRTDILVHNLGEEGWAALSHKLPSYETMLKINERLKNDLDETKTSLLDLENEHEAALAANQKISDAAVKAADKVINLQKEKDDLTVDFNVKLAKAEKEKSDLADKRADLEKQQNDDRAAIQAMKLKLSLIAGGIALASIAGVIWSPIGKAGLAAFAAICGLASVGIWYITGPVILAAVGVAAIGLVGYGLYRHHASDKTVTALTNYLHEKGQIASQDLAEWTTKYIKSNDGSIKTVPDPAVLNIIQQKLIQTDRQ